MSRRILVICSLLLVLLIASCASIIPARAKYKYGEAKAELSIVRLGLGMYQADNDYARYPESPMITSYADILKVLSPYMRMPSAKDVSWEFISYTSAQPDTFVLVGAAKDRKRTRLYVTPTRIDP